MYIKNYFLLIFCFLMGCTTVGYVEPKSGPVAKARFSSSSRGATIVWGYEDSSCSGESEWLRLSNGMFSNSAPREIGMPPNQSTKKNSFKEFYVSSGQYHTFLFKGEMIRGMTVYTCGVPVRFKFDANEMYELNYQYDIYNKCSVEINKIVVGSLREVGFDKIATFSNSPVGFGEGCVRAFNKGRLY